MVLSQRKQAKLRSLYYILQQCFFNRFCVALLEIPDRNVEVYVYQHLEAILNSMEVVVNGF